jgi:hypothetical protein
VAKLKSFSQINTGDTDTKLIQQNIAQAVAGAISSPLLDGRLIRDTALSSGANKIEHKLNRVPIGYILVDIDNNSTVYRTAKDKLYLTLTASAAVTVSIWVF